MYWHRKTFNFLDFDMLAFVWTLVNEQIFLELATIINSLNFRQISRKSTQFLKYFISRNCTKRMFLLILDVFSPRDDTDVEVVNYRCSVNLFVFSCSNENWFHLTDSLTPANIDFYSDVTCCYFKDLLTAFSLFLSQTARN